MKLFCCTPGVGEAEYPHHLRSPHSLFLIILLVLFSVQVNIIPIIAKADTISKSELHKFKIKIMSELVSNGVQIYQFPTDDEAVAEINSVMNVSHVLQISVTLCSSSISKLTWIVQSISTTVL